MQIGRKIGFSMPEHACNKRAPEHNNETESCKNLSSYFKPLECTVMFAF